MLHCKETLAPVMSGERDDTVYCNSDNGILSRLTECARQFFICLKHVHCTRAIVFTVFYRLFFREIFVKLNIHDNKFLKQRKHFRSLFKTTDADKTCRLHYCLVVFNITNDISLLKIAS